MTNSATFSKKFNICLDIIGFPLSMNKMLMLASLFECGAAKSSPVQKLLNGMN